MENGKYIFKPRPIKVRLWDARFNKLIYGKDIIALFLNKNYEISSQFPIVEGDITEVVTEWIGLLDNTGKEIYNGDIVKYEHKKGKTDSPWYRGYAQVEYDNEIMCGYRAYNPSWIIQLHPLNIVDYQIIIVGNVFENKDLLEMVHNTIIC